MKGGNLTVVRDETNLPDFFYTNGCFNIEPRKLYVVFALKSSVPLLYFVFLWYEVISCNTYGLWRACIYNVVFDFAALPVHTYHFP